MALILSAATGNFNAGATWVGGVVPTVGDEAQAATGHTITITANVTCDLISNAGTGLYTLNDGVTLTANVTNKSTTASRSCLQFTAASPAQGFIVGNCTGGTVTSAIGASNGSGTLNIIGNVTSGSGGSSNGATNGNGTLTITGNVTAGSGANGANNVGTGTLNIIGNATGSSAGNVHGANNSLTGTLNITGNATGGSGANGHGANNAAAGVINITGNATGGSVSTSHGANNAAAGVINITGNATGGSVSGASGANNAAAGILAINGNATGGVSGPGVTNASSGSVTATRAVGNAFGLGSVGLAAATGIANSGNAGVVEVRELEYGLRGMSPVTGFVRLKRDSLNQAIFNWLNTGAAKILVDATQGQMPAATDVRNGVSYASGALTGSAFIPLASSVASGVPVDATTGTAVLTAAAVWSHATRTITGGTVDTLTNAPASVTPSDIWSHSSRTITGGTVDTLTNAPTVPSAASIRAEIDSNSTQLAAIKVKTDNLPASPAATGDIPSANISAIKAKTDLLETTRLAQCSTVSTTGAQLAAALS
jgi:hypothetical protein